MAQGEVVKRSKDILAGRAAMPNELLELSEKLEAEGALALARGLLERGYQSEGEALGKVVRAKLNSCQLSTYFVGRMAFYRLRQEVQREQGDKFDLGRYHEAVLAHGTLPVKYLPELVRERLKQPR